MPVPRKEEAVPIEIGDGEPLKLECLHFLDCIEKRKTPLTDGHNGLRVLKVLEACQRSMKEMVKVLVSGQKKKKEKIIFYT
jgi:UDP-2-acetamido-3-amino-2,3-dideoxy-glucuronate N-acetyltransferase